MCAEIEGPEDQTVRRFAEYIVHVVDPDDLVSEVEVVQSGCASCGSASCCGGVSKDEYMKRTASLTRRK